MLVSVQANVRTAEASRKGLHAGLDVAFKSGAVTGMLVAGLALLSIAVYYYLLLTFNVDEREIVNALVALRFWSFFNFNFCKIRWWYIYKRR